MPAKIKNISTETIVFETFSLAPDETATLQWNQTSMTPKTFGKIVAMQEDGKVTFYDANDVEITTNLDFNYYERDQNGVVSPTETQNSTPEVNKMLNDLFNAL